MKQLFAGPSKPGYCHQTAILERLAKAPLATTMLNSSMSSLCTRGRVRLECNTIFLIVNKLAFIWGTFAKVQDRFLIGVEQMFQSSVRTFRLCTNDLPKEQPSRADHSATFLNIEQNMSCDSFTRNVLFHQRQKIGRPQQNQTSSL